MSPFSLGILAAAGGGLSQYYLLTHNTGANNVFQAGAIKANGNIIVSAEQNGDLFLLEIEPLGNFVSAPKFTVNYSGSFFWSPRDMVLDSLGNIYLASTLPEVPSSESAFGYTKFDSNYNVVNRSNQGHSENSPALDITINGNDIFMTGEDDLSTSQRTIVGKYRSNLDATPVWLRYLSGTNGTFTANSTADSSSNVYTSLYYSDGIGNLPAVIFKHDGNGNAVFARQVSLSGFEYGITGAIEIDNNASDFHFAIRNVDTNGGQPNILSLVKMASNGAVLQSKHLVRGGASVRPIDLKVDSQGNIILSTADFALGGQTLIKYDSNYNIIWQRNINYGSPKEGEILIDANDDIYLYGIIDTSTGAKGFVVYYPGDGSITGTYEIEGQAVTIQESDYFTTTQTLNATSTSNVTSSNASDLSNRGTPITTAGASSSTIVIENI